ncbi:hypothetical protein CC80DRAFT_315570 [Byssothecium circinans]|uniref:Uncharacterized protein n=1 Tax=Byssothecium circinans TaxID=147558 RepID=A0A6A5T886_9PLEO|nr:hypothetical protein CC80DRAFT_315570 [Byssothecium circinans]
MCRRSPLGTGFCKSHAYVVVAIITREPRLLTCLPAYLSSLICLLIDTWGACVFQSVCFLCCLCAIELCFATLASSRWLQKWAYRGARPSQCTGSSANNNYIVGPMDRAYRSSVSPSSSSPSIYCLEASRGPEDGPGSATVGGRAPDIPSQSRSEDERLEDLGEDVYCRTPGVYQW